ncbi:putative DMT superfamily transporter inner membrane protein [uncultured Eubacterium sp.]|nr:putative DMT superfamily transporter inner membrane protein [uncultured Eubacterium sp.]
MKTASMKGVIFLILAAIIWGFALVAQKAGTETLGPLTFTGIRCTLGSLSMFPLIVVLDKKKTLEQKAAEHHPATLLKGGFICGLVVFFFTILQQTGIQFTTVGKSGFITALYIILVPLGGLFLKKKVAKKIWIAVLIALSGFYLMCMSEGLTGINKGDIMMLLASLGCAVHIYVIDYYVNKIDPVKFSSLQFLVTGLISLVLALFLEDIYWNRIFAAAVPILYAGVVSCGLGYTFQILGQKYVEPAKASLLLSSETIFTMLAGMLFFQEMLSMKEYLGCGLIFFAIILSQIERKS